MKSVNINLFLLVIILVGLISLGCKRGEVAKNTELARIEESRSIEQKIKQISVLYFNCILDEKKSVRVEDMKLRIPDFRTNNKGILDAEITDSTKLNKIEGLLKNLQNADRQNMPNVRIFTKIIYNDKKIDTLLIGGMYCDEIFINGVQKVANNELLFQLKNAIGFYPWIIGDEMFKMKELKDPSFSKDPFVSNKYYQDYQTALANR